MRKELLRMIEHDDFLYYAFIRDGIKGLIERLTIRLTNEPALVKEQEILQFINNHKYSLSD
jgi:hypothetical protein